MINVEKTIESIAQKHLNIETLKTRNSDDLDFHDVSVWSMRDALLAAFEAGRSEGKTKKQFIETGDAGTNYQATIEAKYEDLVEMWGEPLNPKDDKIEAKWIIRPGEDMIVTIYNYKNSHAYNKKYPEITKVREWHVGGSGTTWCDEDAADFLLGTMMSRAKLIHRAEKPSNKG